MINLQIYLKKITIFTVLLFKASPWLQASQHNSKPKKSLTFQSLPYDLRRTIVEFTEYACINKKYIDGTPTPEEDFFINVNRIYRNTKSQRTSLQDAVYHADYQHVHFLMVMGADANKTTQQFPTPAIYDALKTPQELIPYTDLKEFKKNRIKIIKCLIFNKVSIKSLNEKYKNQIRKITQL